MMDLMPIAKNCRCFLDGFVLSPSLTLGLSSYNKKTGKSSGPKSITICTTTTLYKLMVFFLALMMLFRLFHLVSRIKDRAFYRKKMRRKRKMRAKS